MADTNALASSNRRPAGVCSAESLDVIEVCVSQRADGRGLSKYNATEHGVNNARAN